LQATALHWFDWPAIFKRYQKLSDLPWGQCQTIWEKYHRSPDVRPFRSKHSPRDRARIMRDYFDGINVRMSLTEATKTKDPVLDYSLRYHNWLCDKIHKHLPDMERSSIDNTITRHQAVVVLRYFVDMSNPSQFLLIWCFQMLTGVEPLAPILYRPLSECSEYITLIRHSSHAAAPKDEEKHQHASAGLQKIIEIKLPIPSPITLSAQANFLIHLPSASSRQQRNVIGSVTIGEPSDVLEEISDGECAVISVLGIDGWSVLHEGWQDFHECFKHLNIFIFFRDTAARWRQDLSYEKWHQLEGELLIAGSGSSKPDELRWAQFKLCDLASANDTNLAVQHLYYLWDMLYESRSTIHAQHAPLKLQSKRNRLDAGLC